jgi:hypothetical protein
MTAPATSENPKRHGELRARGSRDARGSLRLERRREKPSSPPQVLGGSLISKYVNEKGILLIAGVLFLLFALTTALPLLGVI